MAMDTDTDEALRTALAALELADSEPEVAALIIEGWADKLYLLAARLRAKARGDGGHKDTISDGGMGDRVSARVIGPDGSLKGLGNSN